MSQTSKVKVPKTPNMDSVTMQFWNAFGTTAGKLLDPGCYDVAVELGFYKNVRARMEMFEDPKFMKQTLHCCLKAGAEAQLLAIAKNKRTITPEIFRIVVSNMAEEVKAAQARRSGGQLRGGIC